MLYTKCTVRDGLGGHCGHTDVCTLVQTYVYTHKGDRVLLHEHRVCFEHRRQMGLPEQDIAILPDGLHHLADA